MRVSGRCHDRIHRTDRADEFDVNSFWFLSGFFLLRLFSAFDAVSSLYAMFFKALGYMAFQRPGLLL